MFRLLVCRFLLIADETASGWIITTTSVSCACLYIMPLFLLTYFTCWCRWDWRILITLLSLGCLSHDYVVIHTSYVSHAFDFMSGNSVFCSGYWYVIIIIIIVYKASYGRNLITCVHVSLLHCKHLKSIWTDNIE